MVNVSCGCSAFTSVQILGIVGNLVLFYVVNFAVSMLKWGGMYTIMDRICRQPAYWLAVTVRLTDPKTH